MLKKPLQTADEFIASPVSREITLTNERVDI